MGDLVTFAHQRSKPRSKYAAAGTNCHGRSCHIHSLAHRTAGNTEESNPNSLQHKAAGVSDSNGVGGPVAVTYQMLASSVADFHHL